MPFASVARVTRRFATLPPSQQLLFVKILAVTSFVEVGVRVTTLPRIASLLGVRLSSTPGDNEPAGELSAAQISTVRAVRVLMRRWHLAAGPCLRESLVMGFLLRSHQPRLHLGVKHSEGNMEAHAWLSVAGTVIGWLPGYVELPLAALPVKLKPSS